MSSCKELMNEPTPIKPGGPSGCSSSAPGAAEVEQLAPVTATTLVEFDEGLWDVWESDWSSEWEEDWESGGEKDSFVRKMGPDDDSEPKIKKLKSMKILTRDDRISPARAERGGSESSELASDEDIIKLDDDSTDPEEEDDSTDVEEEEDDSFDSGEEAALAPGLACHYCHRRNVKQKVQCSRCPIRICGLCLQNRNGEKLQVETQEGVKWVCPKCRAGCGPGCNTCCTCAPCRKSRGLPPTGQLIRLAKQVGFDNVHDYLIYRETAESPEKIAKRKEGRGWTKAGGAMSSRCPGATVGMLKPAQFWADCATAKQHIDIQRTHGREAMIKEGRARTKVGRGATSCRSETVATVGVLKPAQFWADCVTAKEVTADLDDWQSREKTAKWEKGESWATAGRATSSRSIGATVGILRPAELSADRGPATRATDEIHNQPTRQQNRLAWTMPKAVGDVWKSTNNNVNRGDKDQGGASLPCGDLEKTTDVSETVNFSKNGEHEGAVARTVLHHVLGRETKQPVDVIPKAVGDVGKSSNNHVHRGDKDRGGASLPCADIEKTTDVLETVKSNNGEHEGAVARTVLHQILGRETKQPVHVKLSLDQILNRLLNRPEGRSAAQDRSGPLSGGIRQMRRNRKHRKMGRILDSSMFRKRKSKNCQAANMDTANPGFIPTAEVEDVHLDQSAKAAAIVPENKPISQLAGQTAQDGRHHHDRPSFDAWIRFKRPVTSLQALRKMGVFAKRNTADITAVQESAQKPALPTTAPPVVVVAVAHSSDQTLKQSSPVPATSRPSRSGSQAILMRHQEKRKKMEFRSCLKPQSTTPAIPSARDNRLMTDVAAWRGERARPSTGFEFPKRHVSEVQSGFESFSQKEAVIGFGSFKGQETELSALKT